MSTQQNAILLSTFLDYQQKAQNLTVQELFHHTLRFTEEKMEIEGAFLEIKKAQNDSVNVYYSGGRVKAFRSKTIITTLKNQEKSFFINKWPAMLEKLLCFSSHAYSYVNELSAEQNDESRYFLLLSIAKKRVDDQTKLLVSQCDLALQGALRLEKLVNLESKHTALLESTTDLLLILDDQLVVKEVNKGVSAGSVEMVGKPILSFLLDPEQRKIADYHLSRALEQGVESSYEIAQVVEGQKYIFESIVIPCFREEKVQELMLFTRNISAIKQVVESLQTSDLRYKTLVEGAKSAIFRFNNKGVIRFANQFAIEFFGFSKEELINHHVLETIVPKEDSYGNDLTEMVQIAFADPKKLTSKENENICKDGKRVWMSWSNRPIYDEDGNFTELLSIGNDITQVKEKEKELERQSHIIDQVYDAVICTDLQGNTFYVNQGAVNLTGHAKDELIGNKAFIFADDKNIDQIVSRIKAKGNYAVNVTRSVQKEKQIELEISYSLLKDYDKKPYGLLAYIRDVSKQNRDRETINRLALLVKNSKDLIGIANLDGTVVFYNQAAEELLNIESKDSRTMYDYFSEDEANRLKEEILPTVLKEGHWVGESQFVNIKTGVHIDIFFDVFRIDDPDTGKPLHYATVSRDIRKEKKQQQKLVESELALNEAQRIGKMGSWVLDHTDNTVQWSEEIYRLFDLEVGEGNPSFETYMQFVHPEDKEFIEKGFRDHIERRKPYDAIYRVVTRKERLKYVRKCVRTIRDDNGRPLKTLGIAVDITDQQISRIELQEYRDELEQLLKRRNKELRSISSQLSKSEESYRGLVEGTAMGMGMARGKTIIYANRALLDMFGYPSREEFFKNNIFDLVAPKDKQVLMDRLQKLDSGKSVPPTFQASFQKSNGDIITCQVAVSDIYFESEMVRQASFIDITELQDTKQKLRESETLYRTLTDTIKDVISVCDSDLNCVFVSKGVEQMLGYSEKEITQYKISELIHPDELKPFTQKLSRAIERKQKGLVSHTRIRKKNGKYIWVEHSSKIRFNKKGKIVQLVTSSRDITRRMVAAQNLEKLNEDLKESNKEYKKIASELSQRIAEVNSKTELIKEQNALLSNSEYELKLLNTQLNVRNDAINQIAIVSVTDSRGMLMEVNDRFCQVSKYRRDEIINNSHNIVNANYHPSEFFKEMWETINAGKVWRGEIKNKAKDGSYFWLLMAIIPFKKEKHSEVFFFSLSNDITEQKERELELADAKKKAELAMKAKEDFLSVMSHEIRTPLNSVIGLSELLNKDPDKVQPDTLQVLNSSASNLMRLITDILDFSKIEAQKLTIERHPFNLYEVLKEIKATHEPITAKKGLTFNVFTDAQLPRFVVSDEVRLKQILNNLITNAIKFTDEGQVTLTTEVAKQHKKKMHVRFTITDTGIGIKAKEQQLIFEAFEQSKNQKSRDNGGTGLGLAIVKNLVDLFKGTIKIKSELDQGAEFTVDLPFDTMSLNESELSLSTAIEEEVGDLSGKKVLYVEDVVTNQFLMQKFLENLKVSCDIANNGQEALNCITKEQYDLILMDIQMPGMDGLETAELIRAYDKHYNEIPILAFTADVSEAARHNIRKAGMNDFIAKPLDSRRVVTLMNKYLLNGEHLKGSQLNLQYFLRAFGDDKSKVKAFFAYFSEDIQKFESAFFEAYKNKDLPGMRKEMHKMEPILAQLKYREILDMFEEYRSYEQVSPKMETLNSTLKEALIKLERKLFLFSKT